MFFADLVAALLVALLVWAIFAFAFRRPGPFAGVWVAFFLIFLAAWIGGAWANPIGPAAYGVYWLPFLFFALLFALLLAAIPSPRRDVTVREVAAAENATAAALGAFFRILVLFMILGIVAAYVFGPA